ncbi:tetratricopeptide repeat protein [Nitrospinae bacterium AH_259_B05_G02_I21]|nr:tetratricopeptide repeat protein [Nitrospinae bacterium AH_259_B05_G02_I21]MDA2931926.1 tetratricopeptide repeat protein [Nitrospinae bacterium AH-259-F20]
MTSSLFRIPLSVQQCLVGLVAITLVAAPLLVGCSRREEAHRLYEEGYRISHFQKNPVRAEPLFLKALEIDPTLTQAHVGLAEVYRVMGLLEKREHHFREVLRKAPDHIEAHYQLGTFALERGDYSLALQEFETVHRLLRWPFGLEPGKFWIDMLIYKGFLLLNEGDIRRAEVILKQYLSSDPADHRAYLGLMLIAAKRQDMVEAERLVKEVGRFTNAGDALFYRALLNIWAGRPERAISTLEPALTKAASITDRNQTEAVSWRLRRYLAWAYWKAGRTAEAKALTPELPHDPTPSVMKVLAMEWR